jgi:integrase
VHAAHGEDLMQVAVARAGEINRALLECSSPGAQFAKTTINEACDLYLLSKETQPDVSGRSVQKYSSSLARVKEYAERTADGRRRRHLHSLDSKWCEDLSKWLDGVRCTRNGGPVTPRNPERPLSTKQKREIKRCFKSVIEFARFRTPPLVPSSFTNPITKQIVGRAPNNGHALSGPPVTMDELVSIVAELDTYGLGLLGTLFLYGPRPSELGRILRSDCDDVAGFLHVISRPDTGYHTKGRRDKTWPVTETLAAILRPFLVRGPGPVFVKRGAFLGKMVPPLAHTDGPRLILEFDARLREETSRLGRAPMKGRIERISQAVWTAAGAVSAKDVARELARAARLAGLARKPTPKDVRHLFATQCAEARLAPGVIRQLLGHAPLRGDMLVHYIHTRRDVMREQVDILDQRRKPLIDALAARAQELARGRDA